MTTQDSVGQLLTFRLAQDEYAADLAHLEEVVACGALTRVAGLPAFIRGAADIRGQSVPVIDLASRLGFGETEIGRWACLLIVRVTVHGEPTALGLLVEALRQLMEYAPPDLEPPPLGTRVQPEYLKGLLRLEDRCLPLLDLRRLLSSEELLNLRVSKSLTAGAHEHSV